jgi:natural product precursor
MKKLGKIKLKSIQKSDDVAYLDNLAMKQLKGGTIWYICWRKQGNEYHRFDTCYQSLAMAWLNAWESLGWETTFIPYNDETGYYGFQHYYLHEC